MKRSVLILFFSWILLPGCDENLIDPKYGTGDDYMIYREIIMDRYSEFDLIILNDSTFGERYDSNSIPYLCENIPGLCPETVINYINKNSERSRLRDIPGIKNYIFSSLYNGKKINSIHISFSNIGYNILKTQAVLTIAQSYGGWDGSGFLFFMKKVGNRWKIIQSLGTWIS